MLSTAWFYNVSIQLSVGESEFHLLLGRFLMVSLLQQWAVFEINRQPSLASKTLRYKAQFLFLIGSQWRVVGWTAGAHNSLTEDCPSFDFITVHDLCQSVFDVL